MNVIPKCKGLYLITKERENYNTKKTEKIFQITYVVYAYKRGCVRFPLFHL